MGAPRQPRLRRLQYGRREPQLCASRTAALLLLCGAAVAAYPPAVLRLPDREGATNTSGVAPEPASPAPPWPGNGSATPAPTPPPPQPPPSPPTPPADRDYLCNLTARSCRRVPKGQPSGKTLAECQQECTAPWPLPTPRPGPGPSPGPAPGPAPVPPGPAPKLGWACDTTLGRCVQTTSGSPLDKCTAACRKPHPLPPGPPSGGPTPSPPSGGSSAAHIVIPIGAVAVVTAVAGAAIVTRWGCTPAVVERGDRIPDEMCAAQAFREAYYRQFKEELSDGDLLDVLIVPGDPKTNGNPQHIVQLSAGSARERARGAALPLKHKYTKAFKRHGGNPAIYFHID
eukprot:TRINITY_DN9959_c0_g1_i1.p1 TRINITY_DN9959_c0_g1~~TRINITY_DN9959_c0_g1_i1.p1  ORF type:complete len:369 (+),score=56.49 TRINITY_DN9959_c0_g1_i1:82-1107(+)